MHARTQRRERLGVGARDALLAPAPAHGRRVCHPGRGRRRGPGRGRRRGRASAGADQDRGVGGGGGVVGVAVHAERSEDDGAGDGQHGDRAVGPAQAAVGAG
ncbi:hypothetical protein E8D37_09125 [Nocardioides sp. GY 10127]|nr:hypothetical protein E8D37_09125 [Nocardioides sp. GY 10127]